MDGPTIVDVEADRRFRRIAAAAGKDPDDPWVGGYVDYEWTNGRILIDCFVPDLRHARVLEFGCNVGATAIVLRHQGAGVTAVDIDPGAVALARANADRHGARDIELMLLGQGAAALPFASGGFDLVTCNSVLEYVAPALLGRVVDELDRVLRPGGTILVIGTSNRLAPCEVHSRRWLVNFLPRWVDGVAGDGASRQRGLWPWTIRRSLPGYRDLVLADRGAAYLRARRAIGTAPAKLALLRAAAPAARLFGWSVGMLTPSIFLALGKPEAGERR
jgi:SAM-dependent methyltransferase